MPAAPVNDIASALDNPFARSTGQLVSCEAPDGTKVTSTGPAIRLSDTPPLARGAPSLAADLASVLAEIGIDETECAALKAKGVV